MENATLRLKSRIASQIDRTVKYTYTSLHEASPDVHLEVAHIDKQDGKHILCVPSQSNCAMACKFCHTTGMAGKVPVSNLSVEEMVESVAHTIREVRERFAHTHLPETPDPITLPWLISFMGCGEPMNNWRSIIRAMVQLRDDAAPAGPAFRFAIATMLPAKASEDFLAFAGFVRKLRLPVKLHLSLHFSNDTHRREWMPAAHPIKESLDLLGFYRDHTGQPVELHYTLIKGVNDRLVDLYDLTALLGGRNIPIKFLHFAPKAGDTHESPSEAWQEFVCEFLQQHQIVTERYAPPGADIEAACGQFTVSDYIETTNLVKIEAAS